MSPGRRIAILGVAAVVLVAGLVLAQGSGEDEPQPTEPTRTVAADTTPSTAVRETPPAPPPPRVETIRMRDRAPAGEVRTLSYDTGETVRLRFRSDVAEEVHIHGYDEVVDVPAGGTATARFTADAEGIFEIESHGSGELLAKLEVSP